MRFLADECCTAAVIAAANDHGRVLLTEDLDFGDLAVRRELIRTAVVLIRIPATRNPIKPARILRLLETAEEKIVGAYVVVEEHRFRFRPLARS